jgi:hypothetical protein
MWYNSPVVARVRRANLGHPFIRLYRALWLLHQGIDVHVRLGLSSSTRLHIDQHRQNQAVGSFNIIGTMPSGAQAMLANPWTDANVFMKNFISFYRARVESVIHRLKNHGWCETAFRGANSGTLWHTLISLIVDSVMSDLPDLPDLADLSDSPVCGFLDS